MAAFVRASIESSHIKTQTSEKNHANTGDMKVLDASRMFRASAGSRSLCEIGETGPHKSSLSVLNVGSASFANERDYSPSARPTFAFMNVNCVIDALLLKSTQSTELHAALVDSSNDSGFLMEQNPHTKGAMSSSHMRRDGESTIIRGFDEWRRGAVRRRPSTVTSRCTPTARSSLHSIRCLPQ